MFVISLRYRWGDGIKSLRNRKVEITSRRLCLVPLIYTLATLTVGGMRCYRRGSSSSSLSPFEPCDCFIVPPHWFNLRRNPSLHPGASPEEVSAINNDENQCVMIKAATWKLIYEIFVLSVRLSFNSLHSCQRRVTLAVNRKKIIAESERKSSCLSDFVHIVAPLASYHERFFDSTGVAFTAWNLRLADNFTWNALTTYLCAKFRALSDFATREASRLDQQISTRWQSSIVVLAI